MKNINTPTMSRSIIDNSEASSEKQDSDGSIADWAYQQFFDLGCQIYHLNIKKDGLAFLLKIQQL